MTDKELSDLLIDNLGKRMSMSMQGFVYTLHIEGKEHALNEDQADRVGAMLMDGTLRPCHAAP